MADFESTKRLVKYGFVKPKHRSWFNDNLHNIDAALSKLPAEKIKAMADEENREVAMDVFEDTGMPNPHKRHWLIFEAPNEYVEEPYFWILENLQYDWAFPKVDKITDVFAASEQSTFFGVSEQRLKIQQDTAGTYMKAISEMVKSLFQIVREIRIINERLDYYIDTYENGAAAEGSEITLKSIWTDQVEGGVKNPTSVFGLAQTVGFTILPDLFFRIRSNDEGINKAEDIAAFNNKSRAAIRDIKNVVDSLEFNEKIKEVLKRKLTQYYTWKARTYQELETRRKFTIKYLRQHYDVIKLYIGWVKPYLRNIRRLQLADKEYIGPKSVDMIGAFETAMIEIEFLAQRPVKGNYYSCVLVNFLYRTRPSMSYMGEGYQRAPAHMGKVQFILRSYVWTKEQIANYKRMKEEEDLELIKSINESVKEAMDALGDELKQYLLEGGEDIPRKEKGKKDVPRKTVFEPFGALFGGFKDMFGLFFKFPKLDFGSKGPKAEELYDEKQTAEKFLNTVVYQTYKNFKKAHRMTQW